MQRRILGDGHHKLADTLVSLGTALASAADSRDEMESARALIEQALALLPMAPVTVQTPCGPYQGVRLPAGETSLSRWVKRMRALDSSPTPFARLVFLEIRSQDPTPCRFETAHLSLPRAQRSESWASPS